MDADLVATYFDRYVETQGVLPEHLDAVGEQYREQATSPGSNYTRSPTSPRRGAPTTSRPIRRSDAGR